MKLVRNMVYIMVFTALLGATIYALILVGA